MTEEQRAEIAIFTNAGIPQKILANDYNVSVHTIAAISNQRKRWINESDIAKTSHQKFLYAQKAYGDESLSERARWKIERKILEPIAKKVAMLSLPGVFPEAELIAIIFGYRKLDKLASVQEYSKLLEQYALVILRHGARKGVVYDSLSDAANDVALVIGKLEEAARLRSGEQKRKESLKKRIEEAVKTLPYRERETIKLRYGIGDGFVYTRKEVGRIFKISKEKARQIEARAIKKLQHPVRKRELEEILDIRTD